VKGTWQGSGTFEVTGVGIGPLIAVAAIVAMASTLAAIVAAILAALFWILVAVAVVLVAVIVLMVLAIRRSMAAHRPSFTVQAEVIREPRPQVTAARAPAEVHYHGGTHLHVEAGADMAVVRQSIPAEALEALGAIAREER
jgi:hypothetical protein